jgi:hypothetical protein
MTHKNPEDAKAYARRYYEAYREERREYDRSRPKRDWDYEYSRVYRHKRRAEVLIHYGGRCACCGEDRYEFLAIDHINGGGNRERKELGAKEAGSELWLRLKRLGYPDGFRVLCHNCNNAIAHYGRCAHEHTAGPPAHVLAGSLPLSVPR